MLGNFFSFTLVSFGVAVASALLTRNAKKCSLAVIWSDFNNVVYNLNITRENLNVDVVIFEQLPDRPSLAWPTITEELFYREIPESQ